VNGHNDEITLVLGSDSGNTFSQWGRMPPRIEAKKTDRDVLEEVAAGDPSPTL